MPVQNHRFPLRRQIVWGMRLFTAIVSLAVGLALFWLSNRYVRDNTLQSAEFNLRLITEAIQSSLDSADDLLNWAAVDSTIRLYLDRAELTGAQTMTAYKAAQEKYLSSPLQTRILRFFITDEQERFLQFGKPLPNSMALDRASVQLFLSRGYGMALWEDPLLQGHPQGLVLSRPIRARVGAEHRGTVYLGLSPTVITAPATGYAMDQGSALYWEMDGRLWKIEEGELVGSKDLFCEVEFHRLKNRDQPDWLQEATQTSLQLEGREYLAVRVRLEGRDAAVIQLIPENTFLQQPFWYWGLLSFGLVLIVGLSYLLQHWLKWAINRPVEALQARIAAVGAGDFTVDRSIEWDNELGDIGRGINKLAGDIDQLLASRIEDERRKQDLEYRMLQNEVNPHFIYNTLNSIRWMATIQNAPGIAEMVTAFARLTKSISKSTEKLVPLQQELALLNDYFIIQQYRYGGDIEIEVSNIEDESLCQDCMIPRFTLQPLAENAIFHGIEPQGGHGSVLLSIRTDPDTGDVLLTMTDDGVGMPEQVRLHALEEPTGAERQQKFRHVGLWNVHRRIQYSFGEAYGLTLESEEGVGTAVTIRLPYRKQKGAQDDTGPIGGR